jgi:hypothetical protein
MFYHAPVIKDAQFLALLSNFKVIIAGFNLCAGRSAAINRI